MAKGSQSQKHPHGRGEDLKELWQRMVYQETPPRAWGRPGATGQTTSVTGNTPTGVGKTSEQLRGEKVL